MSLTNHNRRQHKSDDCGSLSRSHRDRQSWESCKMRDRIQWSSFSLFKDMRRFKLSNQASELLCLYILILTVPKLSFAQIKIQQQYHHDIPQLHRLPSSHQQTVTDPLRHHLTTQDLPHNLEWAKRLIKTRPQERQDTRPIMNMTDQGRLPDRWTSQRAPSSMQQLRPLAHLVASQGQKLLKTLANHSLELVQQSMATRNRTLNANMENPSAPTMQNQSIQTEYQPSAIGKLHNLLFPSDRYNNKTIVEPSELMQNYLPNGTSEGRSQTTLINLNAPYESQPRLSLAGVKRVAREKQHGKNVRQMKEKSMSVMESSWMDPSTASLENVQFATGQPQTTPGEPEMSVDEHRYKQLQNSSDMQPIEGIQETSPEHMNNKNELYWAANQQTGIVQHSGEASPSYVAPDDSIVSNYGKESYPSDQKSEPSDGLTDESDESPQVMQVEVGQPSEESETSGYYNNQIYTSEDDGQHNASELQENEHQPFNGSVSSTADSNGEPYTTGADIEESNTVGTDLGTSLEADNQTYMTIQLPSQYDSAIRVPPEGYYDDYFKPESSNLMSPPSSSNLISSGNEFATSSHQQVGQSQSYVLGVPHNESDRNFRHSNDVVSNNSYPTHSAVDYTNQYYMNQKPLRQLESSADQSVDFINSNRTSSDFKGLLQNTSQTIQDGDWSQMGNVTTNQQQYIESPEGDSENQSRNNSTDSIQIIIANTNNSSRDPISNEKVINYISEGLNFTTRPGRPPRNTFVNNEMNEGPPPGDPPSYNSPSEPPTTSPEQTTIGPKHPVINYSARAPRVPSVRSERDREQVVVGHQVTRDPYNQPTGEQQQDQYLTFRYSHGQQQQRGQNDDDSDLNRDVDTKNGDFGKYNGHRAESHHVDQSAGDYERTQSSEDSNRLSSNENEEAEQDTDPNATRRDINGYQGNNRGNSKIRQQSFNMQNDRKARHHTKMKEKNQIRRPQLTEARFNPKDLIIQAPTAQPTVTESTISSISQLPSKMKKLKDNQPDKNELMNELLTALDRVKVAIYKLQPLTAKMNAIYRKSVTSNTRDIIMDNHKGTYAKRYPPGDYDDTYDRMHPSELLSRRQTSPAKRRRATDDRMKGSASVSRPIYLPAPKEMLMNRMGRMTLNATASNSSNETTSDSLNLSESKLVATGVGRRLGGGRIEGELKLSKLDPIYQDDDDEEDGHQVSSSEDSAINGTVNVAVETVANETRPDSAAPFFVPSDELDDMVDGQSPLFGYRITIFQSPEEDNSGVLVDSHESDKSGSQFSYQLDLGPDSSSSSPSMDDEVMVTSESSLVESVRGRNSSSSADDQDIMEEGESKKLKKKSEDMKKEEEAKKLEMKEKGEKKKSKKSEMKKKKEEEESKKKKEYKKIKHNKGIVSKEKKTMHRDKHIKAHDRGAAKEKALKERTQIEFFEREQIVDDEFEKGKKSTKKASWTTGHDARKVHKESAGGDTMQSAGSHYVEHGYPKDSYSEKGKAMSVEGSSAKKSSKFEKKNMEAKGKKFKGWREKGYKIITETEFIDRGSLHDSAYKKRDKGAANHQKYKKQEASSEGHHGSMQEHHKKSRNKEEKKHKSQSKKHMKGGEDKKEHKQKESKKSAKKKLHEDHDHEESMLTATVQPIPSLVVDNQQQDSMMSNVQRPFKPVLVSASGNSFQTTPMPNGLPASLLKLLKVDHDDDQLIRSARNHQPANQTSLRNSVLTSEGGQELNSFMRLNHQIPAKAAGMESRSDDANSTSLFENSIRNLGTNGTILDIVENLTGRRLNKSMIGTYELGEQQLMGNKINLTSSNTNSNYNTTSAGYKYLAGGPQPVTRNTSAIHQRTTIPPQIAASMTTPAISSTKSPKPLGNSQQDALDAQFLVNLLQEANLRQQQLQHLKNSERLNQQLIASVKSPFIDHSFEPDQQEMAFRGHVRDHLSEEQIPLTQFLTQPQQQSSGLFNHPSSIFQNSMRQSSLQNNALNQQAVMFSSPELAQGFSAYDPGNRFIDYDQNAMLLAAATASNFPMR